MDKKPNARGLNLVRFAEDLKTWRQAHHLRGESHTFVRIDRRPQPGRSGKIQTTGGVFYVGVFPDIVFRNPGN
jgi:hypothetical protein